MKNNFIKQLRQNSTEAESVLWYRLRAKRFFGIKFRRQSPILHYIVDFVSFEHRLVIEVDGGQHDENRLYDERRAVELEELGYQILRFWNNEVLSNLKGVLQS